MSDAQNKLDPKKFYKEFKGAFTTFLKDIRKSKSPSQTCAEFIKTVTSRMPLQDDNKKLLDNLCNRPPACNTACMDMRDKGIPNVLSARSVLQFVIAIRKHPKITDKQADQILMAYRSNSGGSKYTSQAALGKFVTEILKIFDSNYVEIPELETMRIIEKEAFKDEAMSGFDDELVWLDEKLEDILQSDDSESIKLEKARTLLDEIRDGLPQIIDESERYSAMAAAESLKLGFYSPDDYIEPRRKIFTEAISSVENIRKDTMQSANQITSLFTSVPKVKLAIRKSLLSSKKVFLKKMRAIGEDVDEEHYIGDSIDAYFLSVRYAKEAYDFVSEAMDESRHELEESLNTMMMLRGTNKELMLEQIETIYEEAKKPFLKKRIAIDEKAKEKYQEYFFDPLTGLPNIVKMKKDLRNTVYKCGEEDKPLFLLFVTIDNYDTIKRSIDKEPKDDKKKKKSKTEKLFVNTIKEGYFQSKVAGAFPEEFDPVKDFYFFDDYLFVAVLNGMSQMVEKLQDHIKSIRTAIKGTKNEFLNMSVISMAAIQMAVSSEEDDIDDFIAEEFDKFEGLIELELKSKSNTIFVCTL